MATRFTIPKNRVAWNKGRTYLIAKRRVYANKGAWAQALMRLHGTACMRCGWNEARTDAHHIVHKNNGGTFTLDNGIVLCPNCHRLSHVSGEIQASLAMIKLAAKIVAPSY